jgi:hypothetical protein
MTRSIANSRLLSIVYANSPVNTSPPFAPPPDLAALELETRSRSEEISSVIMQLQPARFIRFVINKLILITAIYNRN